VSDKFILDERGQPKAEPDLMAWADWIETHWKTDRVFKQEQVGDSKVSTIFLGLDHSFGSGGPPVLWETMALGGKLDQEQERCSGTREQAEAMHARMVERVKAAV